MALLYALSGVARAGATRSGYVSGQVFIKYGGVHYGWGKDTAQGVLIGSLSITQELDETADTCRFTVNGGVPSIGDEVIITLGSKNAAPLFAGYGLTVTQKYVGDRPANVQADIAAVDYTWQLGFVLVTAQYRNQTAGAIVQDLVTRYAGANGFTATAVDPNFVYLDEITFTNEDLLNAITRTMRRAGGYWYCDYQRNVHAFLTETGNGPPEPLTPSHKSLADVVRQTERTQVLTRVYVEGRGSRLLGAVASGDTMIPLDAVDMFTVAADVFAKASFQGAEGGAQHLSFAGVVVGAGGAIVGPGVTPSAALVAAAVTGAGIELGAHQYAYTWVTASGETLPSPVASVTHEARAVANPTDALQGVPLSSPGALVPGGSYRYKYGWSLDAAVPPQFVTLASPASSPVAASAQGNILGAIKYSSDPAVTQVNVYRTTAGGSTFYFYLRLPNYPEAGGSVSSVELGANSDANMVAQGILEPSANTATVSTGRTALSGIAVGPSAVTSRKLYRTTANTTPLKLLTTIANNTATTHTDTASDATLGAAPPATNTAALPQPSGQVAQGDTAIVVTSTAAFLSGGGWAVVGNGEQVIRYTALSGNQLTGIPSSGTGSITASIAYGSNITAAPMLTGIPASGPRSIVRPLTAGDEIYLVVQVDDPTAQSGLAADVGGAGVREEWVQDRRLSIAEARARGRATLALRPLDTQTLGYRCRDLRTQVGKFVTANLPAPTNITGDYRILAVTIDNFRPRPNQYPTFSVRASSTHFSFDDWLRRMRTEV